MSSITPSEAEQLAYDAFVYGYPVVDNYRVMYEGAIATGRRFNHIAGKVALYGPDDTIVVVPNNDTAYSNAWLDLRPGPLVLDVPAIEDRYWSFQLIDSFTNNVDYLGSRQTPTAGAPLKFLIAGPGWLGRAPAGMRLVRSPTNMLFLLGRTQIFGEADVPVAASIMNGYQLTPLNVPPGPASPGALPGMAAPTTYPYVDAATIKLARYFFEYLNLCLTHFQGPQASEVDAALMLRLAPLGVGPGRTFDPAALGEQLMTALERGIARADKDIALWASGGQAGWKMIDPQAEFFGTDEEAYAFRAQVCRAGIYANSPAEALYPMAYFDDAGERLDGSKYDYTLTFPIAELPPCDASKKGFWSLTIYNEEQFLVHNDINRYSLGDRSEGLVVPREPTTIYIQADPVAQDKEAGWLPAPKGPFQLVLRVYCPTDKMLDPANNYTVPSLQKTAKKQA